MFNILEALTDHDPSKLTIHICPPFPYLSLMKHMMIGRQISLGAQDMFFEEHGPFTGAVGPYMLQDMGCDLVILGHSERRAYFHETSEEIGKKVAKAAMRDLLPVLCVGESKIQREEAQTFFHIYNQLHSALEHVPCGTKLLVAYEPLWAIGTGQTPLGVEVNMLFQELAKEKLLQRYNIDFIYGGSVTQYNVGEFLTQPYINGVLVGNISLKHQHFIDMIDIAQKVVSQPKQTWVNNI